MTFYIYAYNKERTIQIERIVTDFTEEVMEWLQNIECRGYLLNIKRLS